MATELAKAYVQIIPSAEGIQGSISDVLSGEAENAGKSSGGSLAKSLGGAFKKAVAVLGIGKMIADAISAGGDYEAAMAKVATLYTGDAAGFGDLKETILDLSSTTGMSAQTLAEAAYSAESAGVAMGDLSAMLEGSAKLATAGFTDVDTALSATAKTMNAYGLTGEDAMSRIQTILIQTQNKGITTVGELGQSLAQVTPIAASMGVEFDQVGAALALMTAQGTPTAQATTQLKSAFAELGKKGTKGAEALKKAVKGTKYAGKSFKEIMASGADLGEVMDLLKKYADKTGVSMVDLFSSIEAGNAAMQIAGNVETFTDDLAAMRTEAKVVEEGYDTMSNTFNHSMDSMKESLKNFAIALTNGMDTKKAVSNLIASLKDFLKNAAGMLINLVKGVFESLPDIFDGLTDIADYLLDMLINIDWMSLGQSILDGIVSILDHAGTWLNKLFTSAWEAVRKIDWKQVGQAILNGVKKLIDGAGNFLKNLFGIGKDKAKDDVKWGDIGSSIWGGITSFLGGAGEKISGLFSSALSLITGDGFDWGSIGSTISTAIGNILNPDGENFLTKIFTTGESEVNGIDWVTLGDNVAKAGAAMLNLTGEALAGGFTAAETAIKSINWGALGAVVGTAANGLIKLTGEGLSAAFTAAESIIKTIDWNAVGETVGNAANGLVSLTGEGLSAAFTLAESTIKAIDWNAIGVTVGNAANGLVSLTGAGLSAAFTAAESTIKSINWGALGALVGTAANGLIKLTDATLSGAFTAAETTIKKIDWAGLGETVASVANGLTSLTGEALSGAFTAAESAIKEIKWADLGKALAAVPNAMISIAGASGELLSAPFTAAADVIKGVDWGSIGSAISTGLSTAIEAVGKLVGGVLGGVGDAAAGIGEGVGNSARAAGSWVAGLFKGDEIAAMEEAAGRIETALTGLNSALTTAKTESKTSAKEVGKAIKEGLQENLSTEIGSGIGKSFMVGLNTGMFTMRSTILANFATLRAAVKTGFSIFNWKDIGGDAVSKIGSGVTASAAKITGAFVTIRTNVKNGFTEDSWRDIGKAMDDGLASGIKDNAAKVTNAMKDVIKKAVEAAKKEAGIASPSKLMRDEIGQWIPAGIAEGIRKNANEVGKSMMRIKDQLTSDRLESALMAQTGKLQVQAGTAAGAAGGGYTQNVNVYSPKALSPYETARQVRLNTQNMVLSLRGIKG